MLAKLIGYACVGIALALVAIVAYRTVLPLPGPLLFSPTELLASTWEAYKKTYVEPGTYRTVDKQRGDVTTSEGQSYTMLRAAWMGDKGTFDGAWRWTEENLGRPEDALHAWLWSPEGGILSPNSASDADADIALALIFAYARWQDPAYLASARAIVSDIWEEEVITLGGRPYLAANNVEKRSSAPHVVVNPSYFSPASYRLFAEIDPAHPWEELREATYDALAEMIALPMDGGGPGRLPPDWILLSRAEGVMIASSTPQAPSTFGYDALRVSWRIALDAEWFGNPRAAEILSMLSVLGEEWRQSGRLASVHAHDGSPIDGNEAAALYGGTIGYFIAMDAEAAKEIYRKKLLSLYDPRGGGWATPLSYYDDNWVWFGLGLYHRLLPNLAAELPDSAFTPRAQ